MTRFIRAIAAAALLLLVAAPTAAHATTPVKPQPSLSGVAKCVDGGWTATFTFTNPTRLTAVIVDVEGDLDPAVPLTVAPGASITDTTSVLTGRRAVLSVEYRWERDERPVSEALTRTGGGEHTKTHKLRATVHRCACPTTSPTATPTATPTVTPTTTPTATPTVTPTSTTPPPTVTPTTAPPPSTTPPTTPDDPPAGDQPGTGGGLPLTGAPVGGIVAGGAALLAVGIVALVAVRRRRGTTFSA